MHAKLILRNLTSRRASPFPKSSLPQYTGRRNIPVFCLMFDAQNCPFCAALVLENYYLYNGLRNTSRAGTVKNMFERLSTFHNSVSNMTHSAIATQTFSMSGHILHSTLYSTLYSGKKIQCKVLKIMTHSQCDTVSSPRAVQ